MQISTRSYFSSVALAAALSALAPATPAAAQAAGQDADTCLTQRLEGTVSVTPRGAARQDLRPGQHLVRGAVLRTGADGRATLFCAGGLEVVIGLQTEILIEGVLQGSTRPFGLRLLDGVAGFLFDREDTEVEGVQIRAPSAVAAVRSTEWAAVVEDGTSAFFGREGTVFVFGNDGADPLRLRAGDGVDVPASSVPGPVLRWGAARVAALADRLGPDW